MVSFKRDNFMYYSNSGVPTGLKTHLHRFYEFLYFMDGDSSYIVENTFYDAKPGDLFITRPGELHSLAFRSDKQYVRKFFQITPEYLKDIDVDLLSFIDKNPFGAGNRITADKTQAMHINAILNQIEYYVLNRLPESDIMIKTYVIQFLVQLKYILQDEQLPVTMKFKTDNERISNVLDYIEKNITDAISLDELSEKFFINKYYLCHSFKAETGITIKEFINTRRISRAKELLEKGDNITDLCYKCGFGDYSTFYKTFKKMTGKSPKAFLLE